MNECFRVECVNKTSNKKFCSKRCAAIVNNQSHAKRKPKGRCRECNEPIPSKIRYCNKDCLRRFRARNTPGVQFGKTKRCTACLEIKDYSEFGVNKSVRDGMMRQCKRCNNKRVNAYNKVNKKPSRPAYIRHNLTIEKYESMLVDGLAVCEICKVTEVDGVGKVIDHDHTCCPHAHSCGECVRGILCNHCNQALGLFREDVDRLRAAVLYLSRSGTVVA